MTPEEVEAAVERIVSALGHFVLIKRELHWYRTKEPAVYAEMLERLKGAILGDNRQA